MNQKINDVYWMTIVEEVSHASTCRKALGCVLIKDNYMVGIGYVGSVHGDSHCLGHDYEHQDCLLVDNDDMFGSGDNKSCIRTVHAEMNAILNMQTTIRGVRYNWITCYSTYQPCLNCLKALLQIGVRKFVYKFPYIDKLRDTYIVNLSKQILIDFNMIQIEI